MLRGPASLMLSTLTAAQLKKVRGPASLALSTLTREELDKLRK